MARITAFPIQLIVKLALIAALALAAASCGRRGPPEPPPSAVVYPEDQGMQGERQPETVDRPFILDPLIQ